jgi:fucose 4-O-acetylase-like acetyltransferase
LVESLKFTYLTAIGIILFVLGHTSGGGGFSPVFMDSWFPIYSFDIALFVFAAGYFYKDTLSAFGYLKERFTKLVIPFYVWNLIFGFLITLLVFLGVSNVGNSLSLENFLLKPWTTGDSGYAFNYASWFLIWLFTVEAVYVLLRKFLKLQNEYFWFVIFLIGGLLGTYLSTIGFSSQFLGTTLIKLLFGLPFIQLGYLYRAKLEKHDKVNVKSFLAVLAIQTLIILLFLTDFPFTFVVAGGQFSNVFLPFITSLTGIWFWLQICTFFSQKIGPNRIIGWLGKNTLQLMIFQMFAFWLLNSLFFAVGAPNFDVVAYKSNIYYEYLLFNDAHMLVLYLLAGIIIPLVIYKAVTVMKQRVKSVLATNSKNITQENAANSSDRSVLSETEKISDL